MAENDSGFMLTGKWYDKVKLAVQIWLPASGTLYFTLAQIWGLPSAEQVLGTIAAITTFFGVTLKISANTYYGKHEPYAGDVVVNTDEDGTNFRLVMNGGPELFDGKDTLTLKVLRTQTPPPDDLSASNAG